DLSVGEMFHNSTADIVSRKPGCLKGRIVEQHVNGVAILGLRLIHFLLECATLLGPAFLNLSQPQHRARSTNQSGLVSVQQRCPGKLLRKQTIHLIRKTDVDHSSAKLLELACTPVSVNTMLKMAKEGRLPSTPA